jgi:PhnB protein
MRAQSGPWCGRAKRQQRAQCCCNRAGGLAYQRTNISLWETQPVNWKPVDYPSMSPYLICADGDEMITFVEQVFGGRLQRRFNRPDGSLMHAEVRIDDSILMIGGGATSAQQVAPHIHVYVPDACEVFYRAVAAGATIVQEPQRKRDEDDLRGGVQDASGTTWWIASQ